MLGVRESVCSDGSDGRGDGSDGEKCCSENKGSKGRGKVKRMKGGK